MEETDRFKTLMNGLKIMITAFSVLVLIVMLMFSYRDGKYLEMATLAWVIYVLVANQDVIFKK